MAAALLRTMKAQEWSPGEHDLVWKIVEHFQSTIITAFKLEHDIFSVVDWEENYELNGFNESIFNTVRDLTHDENLSTHIEAAQPLEEANIPSIARTQSS